MPWQKGQSGNPAGRVKHSVRGEIRRLAAHRGMDRKTYAQRLAAEFWLMAFTNNLDAMKTVLEQVDGKLPTPPIEGPAGDGLRIEIVNGDS